MQEQRGNISRDGNPKKNPNGKYKKYKKKNNKTEISNSFREIINTVEMCEERISKPWEMTIQLSKIEVPTVKESERQNRNPRTLGQLQKV